MLALPFAQREPASLGSPSPRLEAKGKARPYPPSVHANLRASFPLPRGGRTRKGGRLLLPACPAKNPRSLSRLLLLAQSTPGATIPRRPNQALEDFLFKRIKRPRASHSDPLRPQAPLRPTTTGSHAPSLPPGSGKGRPTRRPPLSPYSPFFPKTKRPLPKQRPLLFKKVYCYSALLPSRVSPSTPSVPSVPSVSGASNSLSGSKAGSSGWASPSAT